MARQSSKHALCACLMLIRAFCSSAACFHAAVFLAQGVNKTVILSLVDELLARKEVNIW